MVAHFSFWKVLGSNWSGCTANVVTHQNAFFDHPVTGPVDTAAANTSHSNSGFHSTGALHLNLCLGKCILFLGYFKSYVQEDSLRPFKNNFNVNF